MQNPCKKLASWLIAPEILERNSNAGLTDCTTNQYTIQHPPQTMSKSSKGLVVIPRTSLQHLCKYSSLKRNATIVAVRQMRFNLPKTFKSFFKRKKDPKHLPNSF